MQQDLQKNLYNFSCWRQKLQQEFTILNPNPEPKNLFTNSSPPLELNPVYLQRSRPVTLVHPGIPAAEG